MTNPDDAALVAKYRLQTYGRRDDEPVQLSARELDALLAMADEAIAARAEIESLRALVGEDKQNLRNEIRRLLNENLRQQEVIALQRETAESLRRVRDAAAPLSRLRLTTAMVDLHVINKLEQLRAALDADAARGKEKS